MTIGGDSHSRPGQAPGKERWPPLKFIRVGDETIQLSLVTHVKEGAKDETLYGRSVRKSTDHRFGWLEVHFVSGEAIKVEGEAADVLRRILEEELMGTRHPASTPTPTPIPSPIAVRKHIPHEGSNAESSPARHDHPPRQAEEQLTSIRNGFGR